MAANWVIRQGDTTGLQANLRRGNNVLADIASAQWEMHLPKTPDVTITGACTIVDVATGLVQYNPIEADSSIPGTYVGVFRVILTNGRKVTVPTTGSIPLQINPSAF